MVLIQTFDVNGILVDEKKKDTVAPFDEFKTDPSVDSIRYMIDDTAASTASGCGTFYRHQFGL